MRSATQVTLIRIVLIPVLIYLMYFPALHIWAALFFALLAATDWLDGYLARKHNQVSTLGKFLDPLADKVLVLSVLVVLAVQLKLEVFSVLVLITREFAIMGIRVLAANKGTVIAASDLAKYKTATQMVAIFLLLAQWPFGLVLYYVSVLLALVTLVQYMWDNRSSWL